MDRRTCWVGGIVVLVLLVTACKRPPGDSTAAADAGVDATTATAPSIPWQPHGLRRPSVRCELATPEGWTRSASPMGDHVAELSAARSPTTTIIVGERVEPDLSSAVERARAYYRSGLLTGEGTRTLTDAAFPGAGAPGHILSMRWGPPGKGRIETVVVLAFDNLPLVEVIARHDEADTQAQSAVTAFVRAARCVK